MRVRRELTGQEPELTHRVVWECRRRRRTRGARPGPGRREMFHVRTIFSGALTVRLALCVSGSVPGSFRQSLDCLTSQKPHSNNLPNLSLISRTHARTHLAQSRAHSPHNDKQKKNKKKEKGRSCRRTHFCKQWTPLHPPDPPTPKKEKKKRSSSYKWLP